jgi:hypothetical protein
MDVVATLAAADSAPRTIELLTASDKENIPEELTDAGVLSLLNRP